MSARIEVALVAPGDEDALVALFAREGSPCHCRYWHFQGTSKEWEARCAFEPEKNRDELAHAIRTRSVEAQGLVARIDERPGEIVGWLKLAPRASLAKLLLRSPYKQLDLEPTEVLSIGCLLIDPAERRRGVARALVEGAVAEARARGAVAIEAYPRDVRERVHDAELWMGPRGIYDALGFEAVRGDGGQYPVMRRSL